jgi:hypothetical protein
MSGGGVLLGSGGAAGSSKCDKGLRSERSRDESVVDGNAGHELLEDNGCFVIESNLNSVYKPKSA